RVQAEAQTEVGTEEYTLYLRSPEGILFYLGELMHVADPGLPESANKVHKVPEICIAGHLWPLFVAFERHAASGCRVHAVAATYDDRDIVIPDDPPDWSKRSGDDAYECPQLSLRPTGPEGGTLDTQGAKHHKYLALAPTQEPPCFGGMSTESLSLVTQLIALQKSAKDLPTTSVI